MKKKALMSIILSLPHNIMAKSSPEVSLLPHRFKITSIEESDGTHIYFTYTVVNFYWWKVYMFLLVLSLIFSCKLM